MCIEGWRAEIDSIDDQLLRLVNERARLAVKIGTAKGVAGLPLRDPQRENSILARMRRANAGPLDEAAITKLFRRIIRESRFVEAHHARMDFEVTR